MTVNRDIHMEALKFARDNPGFTIEQFHEAFQEDFSWLEREILHSKIFQTDISDRSPNPKRYFLSFEDRFKLLEHEELREARKSSALAFRLALLSIAIALAGIVIQQCSTSRVEISNQPISVQEDSNNESFKEQTPAAGTPDGAP